VELVDLVESGVSILVGTRDASLRPASIRGVGACVASDRRQITVYLPQSTSHKAVENLRDNGEIAVAFARPFDNFAIRSRALRPRVVWGNPWRKHPAPALVAWRTACVCTPRLRGGAPSVPVRLDTAGHQAFR
jgi:hypothetical protein